MAIYKVRNERKVGDGPPSLVPGDLLFGGEYFADEGGTQYRFQVYDELGANKGVMHLPKDWVEANVDVTIREPERVWDGKLVEGAREQALMRRLDERRDTPPLDDTPKEDAPPDEPARRERAVAPVRDVARDFQAVLDEIQKGGPSGTPVDYASVGTDPQTYLKRFPEPLRNALKDGDRKVRIVLHRNTLGESQAVVARLVEQAQSTASASEPVVLPCGLVAKDAPLAAIDSGKFNYPAKYYSLADGDTTEFHLFGLDGESWVIKTLYMLAHCNVKPEQLVMADEGFDVAAYVNATLDRSIDAITGCDGLESLTIGSIGVLMQGLTQIAVDSPAYEELKARQQLDYLARRLEQEKKKAAAFDGAKARPKLEAGLKALLNHEEHGAAAQAALDNLPSKPSADQVVALGGMFGGALLKTAAKPAIADATGAQNLDALTGQISRLDAIRKQHGGDHGAAWAALQRAPEFAGSPLLKQASDQAPTDVDVEKELTPRRKLGDASEDKTPTLLRVNGKCHLMISVTAVHGDLCYWIVRRVLERFPNAAINFQGTCGSVTDEVPKGSMVIPTSIVNLEPGMTKSAPIALANGASAAAIADALGEDAPLIHTGKHGNNCTMLQEYAEGIDAMKRSGLVTVDMESYFVAKAHRDAGGSGALRIILQVADVASSKEHSQQSASRQREDAGVYARKARAIADQLKLK